MILPRKFGIIHDGNKLGALGLRLKQFRFELLDETSICKFDGQLPLRSELQKSLFQRFIQIFHFKFLGINTTNVGSQAFDGGIHLTNYCLVLIVVIIIFSNDLIKIVLLNMNFHSKLLDLLLQAEVVVFLISIYLLCLTNMVLEFMSFVEEM